MLKNNSIKIFIIDSKVESEFLSSPALKISSDSSHGSKVAAVIRSQSRADIKTLSAENIIGRIDKKNYLSALRKVENYAAVHPQETIIVNISLGFEKAESQADIIKDINTLDNIIIVAAAGNNNSENIAYPARLEEVVAAAALENDKKMPASNYGQEIDFAASGIIEITQRHYLPALNYSRSYKLTGTSFAAPQVTALIADILSLNPELNFEKTLAVIADTADKIEDQLFRKNSLGAGSINRFNGLTEANNFYFWLQLAAYTSLIFAVFLLLAFCLHKYSLSVIFIFLIISAALYLMQPFFLILYYQFGFFKIMAFCLSLTAVYALVLKLLKLYLENSSSFTLLLKIGPHLNNKLQAQLKSRIKELLLQNGKIKLKLEQNIISSLRRSYSLKKIDFYLPLACALNRPPIELIVEKSLNYGISAEITASNLNLAARNYKEQCFLIAELLAVVFRGDYSNKKKAGAAAAELNSALMLIPIKNTLKNRKSLHPAPSTLYFLLDIVAAFGSRAADFSSLLKEIITQESNPWLKYHALQAYQKVGVMDSHYQEFIEEIKAKEKEPVLLALKED